MIIPAVAEMPTVRHVDPAVENRERAALKITYEVKE